MPDFLVDLLLPATDRAVAVQFGVAGVFWTVALVAARSLQRDIRHFVWGIFMLNAAWFAVRALH